MMKKAQSTLEYAVLIACIVAALLAMQIYLKRSMQGNLRGAAERLGQQYSPRHTYGTIIINRQAHSNTEVTVDDSDDKKTVTDTTTNVDYDQEKSSGSTTVEELAKERLFEEKH